MDIAICIVMCVGSAIFGYLLGSISNARIMAKAHGIDITQVGSHNPGGTNVWRNLGWKFGLSTMLLDLLKGFLSAFVPLVLALFVPQVKESLSATMGDHLTLVACIGGISAGIGHSFPLYYHFRGGKNVMVACGFILAISPALMVFGLLCFLLVLLIARRVAAGSVSAAASVIVGGAVICTLTGFGVTGYQYLGMYMGASSYFYFDWVAYIFVLLSCVLVVIRHISNIVQMERGESKRDF